jgi:hypothetical protein
MSDLIQTDHPLTEHQRANLEIVLDMIIPASDDGRMPSARDVGFDVFLVEFERDVEQIGRCLDLIENTTGETHNQPFAELGAGARQSLIEELRHRAPELFGHLTRELMYCYYMDDGVLSRLGMKPGAPFPDGNTVVPGDLTLLDPVRARGKIWRDT